MKRIILLGLTFAALFILLSDSEVFAQCAMCRANVKSNIQSGSGVGSTLNHAILYLMAIPYILISIVGYVFFKEKVDNWVMQKLNILKSVLRLREKVSR